jgi:hypothetical protein
MSTNEPARLDDRYADGQRQRQSDLSERTREQRDDLLVCMHKLEAALASPAPGREKEWAQRASRELAEVRQSLERHVLSAEGPNGLFKELDLACTASTPSADELCREHHSILDYMKQLEEQLQKRDQGVDFTASRRDASKLLALIRRHNANEVDLIFKCFWLDIGVGD